MHATPTILIVDDEAPLRELMKVALTEERYRFVEATHGVQALEIARESRPDVVLLDVMLPGQSGLEVLRELRADPELGGVPVVVVSAWQSLDEQRAALELGADAFLPKPFAVEELTNIVETLVQAPR
jgi:DNA-binding response OmpR family regulator